MSTKSPYEPPKSSLVDAQQDDMNRTDTSLCSAPQSMALCTMMKSNTKLRDLISLVLWVNCNSVTNGTVIVLAGATCALYFVNPSENQDILIYLLKLFTVFSTTALAVIFASIPFAFVLVIVNILRKGVLGEKTFSINPEMMIEVDDRGKETRAPWETIKRMAITKRHIYLRYGLFKYFIISKRDFRNEYEFIVFYSELVRYSGNHK